MKRREWLDTQGTGRPEAPWLGGVSEASLAALLENVSEALLLVDSAGTIHQANHAARQTLGLKVTGLAKAALPEFFSSGERRGICAWLRSAAFGQALAPAEGTLETGIPVRMQVLGALEFSGRLLVGLEEGSAAQRAERRCRQLESELRGVLDAVETGILLLDRSGQIRFVNARLGQMLGLEARALGQVASFDEFVEMVQGRFRDPQAFASGSRELASHADEAICEELEIVRPVRRVTERHSRPVLDAEGRRVGRLELYRDITTDRQFESKLLQTEKMAALGQLVSGIAHELNNPLTAIMGYGELLLGHGLRPAQLVEAQRIFQQAERARRIVKNLLFFARETKPERTRVDLNEIVERTLALRSYELKVENIAVDCELEPNLPQTMADPYQLQQVVLNLLINAEHALLHDHGQGHIFIRTRRLSGNRISLEVADDGPGVPPEIASRIFDPFFSTKPPGVGTGLGLSIVYGIVQEHGGEVFLESAEGTGARFIVELPVVAIPAAEAPTPEAEPAAIKSGVAAGRILVVEDEPTVAQLIVDVLREEGHQAEMVMDSQEGLNRLARARYDVVICDLRMPRLDGPAFYEALARTGSPMQHRIIFVTGDTLAPRTLEFLEPHGLPYLAKPFLVEELKLAVNRMFERSREGPRFGPTDEDSSSRAEAARRP